MLWYLPWAIWFDSLPWLRLSLSGVVFIAPGMAISMILLNKRLTLLSHITSGMTISIFLIGSLGVIGRILHLPFAYIKPVIFIVGLISFSALCIYSKKIHQLFKSKDYSITSIGLLLLTIIFGIVIALMSRIESDSFSYLAYLTNFQHSPRLSFSDIFFGTSDLESLRFWLAMLPMNQAFIADISNIHGVLLLGYYLNPVLVAIALLSTYNFFEDLLKSDLHANIALLIKFSFLFLLLDTRQPGNLFFFRISEDKSFAAFALSPVFFLAVNCFLESITVPRAIFVLLTGWGLALTHPIILAYSIFIAGLYVFFVFLPLKNYKGFGINIILLMLVILPSASLRFPSLYGVKILAPFDLETALIENPDTHPIGDRISYIDGTPFYGFNLNKIRIQIDQETPSSWPIFILSWSYLWVLIFGFLWSLSNLRQKDNAIASFIAASSIMVLLCAIPYTGWLIGYFVSARMLWRAPWLFPIGLVGFSLIQEMSKVVLPKAIGESRRKAFTKYAPHILGFVICIVAIGYFSNYQYREKWLSFKGLNEYKAILERQAELGAYLETNIEQPSILLASEDTMNYLPGLSSKAKVVYFRSSFFTPHPVNRGEIRDILSTDENFSIKMRIKVLDKYHVQYILIEDASVYKYFIEYPQYFKWGKLGDYWLAEYKMNAQDQ